MRHSIREDRRSDTTDPHRTPAHLAPAVSSGADTAENATDGSATVACPDCPKSRECHECGEWVCEKCAGEVDVDGEYYEGRVVDHTKVWCAACRPPVCKRWGSGRDQCVLAVEHLGPCRTEATLQSRNPMREHCVAWMLAAIAGQMPEEAYGFAKAAAHFSRDGR